MKLFLATAICSAVGTTFATVAAGAEADLPRPTPEQAAWQDLELGVFIHFDISVFADPKGTNKVTQAEYVRTAERLSEELWSNYGPLNYVWFDGGALPPGKGGPDLVPILKRHQPRAVAFQGPEGLPAGLTRWVGNENGVANYPSWATVRKLNEEGSGHPDGQFWQPGECDVPLRDNLWFWQPNTEHRIRSLNNLMEIYYASVGRNCNLILNASIDRDGLVPAADLRRFEEFGNEIRRRFGKSLAETSGRGATVELALAQPTTIDHVILMEQIAEGERIREYVIEGLVGGEWKPLCSGQSAGHKRIQRFASTGVSKVRVRVPKFAAEPVIRKLAVYRVGG